MYSIDIKTILHLSRKLVQNLVKHPVLVYLVVFTIQNLQNTLIHGGVSTKLYHMCSSSLEQHSELRTILPTQDAAQITHRTVQTVISSSVLYV